MTSMDFIVDLLHENLNCAKTNNQMKLKKLWYQVMFLFSCKKKTLETDLWVELC